MVDYSYYEMKDVEYPIKPRKPALPCDKDGPEAFREYAIKLEEWESLLEEYTEKRNSFQKIATERMQEFKEELYRVYAPPKLREKVFEVIYQKAWEDGRSDGLHSVADCVDDLCWFVRDIIQIIGK